MINSTPGKIVDISLASSLPMIHVNCVRGHALRNAVSAAAAWQVSPIADSRSKHTLRGGGSKLCGIGIVCFEEMLETKLITADGAMLADPTLVGNLTEQMFEPTYWAARGELEPVARGRGSAWFVGADGEQWVLRHFRRGGFIARWSEDRYFWRGEDRVRAFSEWRMLRSLEGAAVPVPVAARYRRAGLWYQCELITKRIVGAEPLSVALGRAPLPPSSWRAIGEAVARMHAVGADHADLNAHNLLIDGGGRISIIDFDRGRMRARGRWMAGNLKRLRHSLKKVARGLPADRFDAESWKWLLSGYGA